MERNVVELGSFTFTVPTGFDSIRMLQISAVSDGHAAAEVFDSHAVTLEAPATVSSHK